MMNNRTKYSFILIIVVHIYTTNGQQYYLGVGIENAQFKDYVNSFGNNTLDLNYSKPPAILVEGGYRANLFKERLKWNLGFTYNKYEIRSGFFNGSTNTPLTYNLTYVSIKPGIYFSVLNEPKIKLQIHTHISHDWLINGKSSYSNIVNDLYRENTFDKTLISFHKGISVEYSLTDSISTYISYNNSNSFREENKDSVAGEKYTLNTNAITCGILFSFFNPFSRKMVCHGSF